MNNKNIEDALRRAVNQTPTVDFEKLAGMPFIKMTDHDYITRQQENHNPRAFKRFSVAVSFCMVMLICFSGWFVQNRLPDSVISLDVNPSIEIVTNMQDKVLTVTALNKDAQKIVGDRDYKNADLGETLDVFLASMIREGFLSPDKNIIMISVENKSIEKAESLSALLDKEIQKSVSAHNITPLILRQAFEKGTKASETDRKYGITMGKARLIHEIISSGTRLSFDELEKMSMEELIDITNEYSVDLNTILQPEDSDASKEEESDLSESTDADRNPTSPSADDRDQIKSEPSTNDQAEDELEDQTNPPEDDTLEQAYDHAEEDSSGRSDNDIEDDAE